MAARKKTGQILLESKVKIVKNLDDHIGYKEGQVVEVVGVDDDDYYHVESTDGIQWYVGREELEVVKSGSGKHERKIAAESKKVKSKVSKMKKSVSKKTTGGGVGDIDDSKIIDHAL